MIGFFKELKKRKEIKKSIEEHKQNQLRYMEMSSSELNSLTDNELFEAALVRTEEKVDHFEFERILDGVSTLSHAEQVFYVTSYYETEVNNGGLCQFFVNSSRIFVPLVADCLDEISAVKHKALFVQFIQDNGIDLNDLSSFMIDSVKDYEAQTRRYPFDDFDNAFFQLKPIQDLLPSYIRAHISEF